MFGHGSKDDTVPVSFGKLSADTLRQAKINVEWDLYDGMGHTTCEEEYRDIKKFVTKILPK